MDDNLPEVDEAVKAVVDAIKAAGLAGDPLRRGDIHHFSCLKDWDLEAECASGCRVCKVPHVYAGIVDGLQCWMPQNIGYVYYPRGC